MMPVCQGLQIFMLDYGGGVKVMIISRDQAFLPGKPNLPVKPEPDKPEYTVVYNVDIVAAVYVSYT